jgi:hypothetical protein
VAAEDEDSKLAPVRRSSSSSMVASWAAAAGAEFDFAEFDVAAAAAAGVTDPFG